MKRARFAAGAFAGLVILAIIVWAASPPERNPMAVPPPETPADRTATAPLSVHKSTLGKNPLPESGGTDATAATGSLPDGAGPLPPEARLKELERLTRLGDAAIPELAARIADARLPLDARRLAAEALVGIGSQAALQELFDAIQRDGDPAVRGHLARALDSLADLEALEPVASLLDTSDDPEIHSAVIDTLARMAQPETVDYLLEMHAGQVAAQGTNTVASRALSALSNPEATGALSMALASPGTSPEITEALARALAKTSTWDSITALAGHAAGSGPVSEASLRELGQLSDPSSLPVVKEIALSGKSAQVREAASGAVERILADKDQLRP